jgi:hypothetical protein
MAYSTINKSTSFFNTVLYTGNGSTQNITGVGFQPDFTWIKARAASGTGNDNHSVCDVIRPKGSYGYPSIYPNLTSAEYNPASGNEVITDFISDGFALGGNENSNYNSNTYVSFNWKAGGTGSANTDGSINSTVSVNTTSGFSIVSYTGNGSSGATVGHGLGEAPEIVLVKKRSGADPWTMLHPNVQASKYMRLDTNAAEVNDDIFNNTRASSTVFTLDSDGQGNGNGSTFVAYCFKKRRGFFTTGEFTANGQADGPFLFCGFKPAFVIIKRKTSTNDWFMFDNKTSSTNPTNAYLRANTTGAAGSYDWIDLVSNGIKIRNTSDGANSNGNTYLFFAWGQPLVGSNNIPSVAR